MEPLNFAVCKLTLHFQWFHPPKSEKNVSRDDWLIWKKSNWGREIVTIPKGKRFRFLIHPCCPVLFWGEERKSICVRQMEWKRTIWRSRVEVILIEMIAQLITFFFVFSCFMEVCTPTFTLITHLNARRCVLFKRLVRGDPTALCFALWR